MPKLQDRKELKVNISLWLMRQNTQGETDRTEEPMGQGKKTATTKPQQKKKKKPKNKPVTQFQLNRFKAGMTRELLDAKIQATSEATGLVNQLMIVALHEQGFQNKAIDKLMQKQNEIGQRLIDDPDYDLATECEKIGYTVGATMNFREAMPAKCQSCIHRMVCQFRSAVEGDTQAACVHYQEKYNE